MSPIRISAVIVANRLGVDPTGCLHALLAGSVAPHEVVVVAPAGAIRQSEAGATVVRHERAHDGATWADACGLGLERSTGELIVVLDAACEVAPDWLGVASSFLDSHTDVAGVEGRRTWKDSTSGATIFAGPIEVDTQPLSWRADIGGGDRVREVACLSATALVVRRSALEQLGRPLLDTRFETELGAIDLLARLLERGFRLYYVPEAEVRCTDSAAWALATGTQASPRDLLLFAAKHLSNERRDQQIDLVARAAHPGLRALLSPPTPSMGAAQAALAWLRAHRRALEAERKQSLASGVAFEAAAEAAQGRGRYSVHARQDVLGLIPASAKVVIDVGCASGVLGAALKRARLGIEVRGVEISPEAAGRAREVLDDVYCGSAESTVPSAWPKPDCVVFADVLEHLPDPWSVLRRYRDLLGPGGTVVVSVPNVAHRSVVEGILHGRFEYVDAGILDRTHLRFFTRASAVGLVENAGFRVERVHCNLDSPSQPGWLRMANRLGVLRAFFQDCQVVQFVMLAKVAE
jgi:2-polyprenyl-3-methyl-5-hydroxy-6-metoxy-1,4-benzoquinol methylase